MPPRKRTNKKPEDKELESLIERRKKAQKKNDIVEEAKLCNLIGIFYTKKEDHETALHYHRTELTLSEAVGDRLGTAIAHRQVGECLCYLGNYDKAYEHERQHFKIAKEIGDVVEEQRALATLGRTYFVHSQSCEVGVEEAKELRINAGSSLLKSLDVCDRLSGSHPEKELLNMRARVYLNLGLIYEQSSDQHSAREFLKKSLSIARELEDYATVLQCHLSLGSLHLRERRPALALRSFRDAVKVASQERCWQQETEVLREMAQAHLLLSNFDKAKYCLKKVVKLLQENSQRAETEEDQKKLNSVRKVGHYSLEMKALGAERAHQKMRMCEKLADICVEIRAYPSAIKYYEQQLELAEAHGLEPKDISTIFISLARTHADYCQYHEAIGYYEKELELNRGNPAAQCHTWSNIASIRVQAGSERHSVMDAYRKAFESAEKSGQPKLMVDVCRAVVRLGRWRKMPELVEWEERMEKLLSVHPDIPDSGSEEEEEEMDCQGGFATPESLSELESADYAEEEEEDDEEVEMVEIALGRTRREDSRRKARLLRRNEKGETMLHVAAISGNLSLVRQLILEGADVNLRDNCGWTPLHEACNHGQMDVAVCLLDNGASVNDPGGDHCEGVTPLIDSASAGHPDVVRLLVERGADLFQTDIMGRTAVDILTATLTETDSSYEMEFEHTAIRDYLAEEMKKRGWTGGVIVTPPSVSSSREKRRSLSLSSEDGSTSRSSSTPTPHLSYHQRQRRRGVGDRTGRNVLESDDDEEDTSPPVIPPPSSRLPPRSREKSLTRGISSNTPSTSRTQYGIGGRETNKTRHLKRPLVGDRPQALISFDRGEMTGAYPVIDHWLEDDVGTPQLKKRKSRDPFTLPSSSYPSSSSSKLSLERKGVNRPKSIERVVGSYFSLGTGSRSHYSSESVRSRRSEGGEDGREDDAVVISHSPPPLMQSSPPAQITHTTGQSSGTNWPTSSSSERYPATPIPTATTTAAATAQPLPLRIRVKIHSRSYLIPCPARLPDGTESTVSWLASKATERYFIQHGERLSLSLTTSDGALLSGDDIVAHVLASGEEVVAVVEDSQLPPLHQRYQTACSVAGQECNKRLMEVFQDSSSHSVLNLSQFPAESPPLILQPGDLPPLFLSLRRHVSLTSISLSGHRLSGEALTLLTGSLALLPNLRVLDLSFTGLTSQGLESLCNVQSSPSSHQPAAGSAGRPWSSLRELDLSNNLLGAGCGLALSSLLSLTPSLLVLGLQECRLSGATIEGSSGIGHTLREMSDLISLDVSQNPLGPLGVVSLMQSLNKTRLSTLLLANTSTDQPLTGVMQGPRALYFFRQVSSSLEKLDLSHCELDTGVLTKLLELCEALQELKLADIGLTFSNIQPFCRFMESCGSLKSIDLMANEGLGNSGCLQIIRACLSMEKNFNIDLRCCGLSSPLPAELSTTLLQLITRETIKIRFDGVNQDEIFQK